MVSWLCHPLSPKSSLFYQMCYSPFELYWAGTIGGVLTGFEVVQLPQRKSLSTSQRPLCKTLHGIEESTSLPEFCWGSRDPDGLRDLIKSLLDWGGCGRAEV